MARYKVFAVHVAYVGMGWTPRGEVVATTLSEALRTARARERSPYRVRVTDPETGDTARTSRPAPPLPAPDTEEHRASRA